MRPMRIAITLICAAGAAAGALAAPAKDAPGAARGSVPARKETHVSLTLTSPAFAPMGAIPKRHTCDGEDVSPPLAWSGLPAGTRSLVLIVDDPDAPDPAAPKRVWVHWVLYNLPPAASPLATGLTAKSLPAGTLEGLNDWQRAGWGGPCPPIGRHRYFHRLAALDVVLPDLHHPTRAALEKAMAGHVLEHTELIGTYQRTH